MITTTLNKISLFSPSEDRWQHLLRCLGKTDADDDPLPLLTILNNNGLDDCLWCLRAAPEQSHLWRLYAVWCARQVQHLMTGKPSIEALDVAEKFALGNATEEELKVARDAARAADAAAYAAATCTVGNAKYAPRGVARDAARAVTWAAPRGERLAVWDAARAAQEKELWRILEKEDVLNCYPHVSEEMKNGRKT